jgi:hypothetical protein
MSEVIRMRGGARLLASEMLPVGYAKVMAAVTALQDEAERLLSAVETADGFEVQNIEHLDFEPTCEWRTKRVECGAVATHVAELDCCHVDSWLICREHIEVAKSRETVYFCRKCGAH